MRAGAGVLDNYRFQAEALATAVLLTKYPVFDDLSPHFLPLPLLDKPWGCLAATLTL